LYRDSTDKIVW